VLACRSDWWLANEAFKRAHALFPDDPAPAAKQLKVWLAASSQDKDMGADAGEQWSGEIRASALYGLVREIGDLARDVGSGADSGRSSMIRTSRDLLYQHISAAKTVRTTPEIIVPTPRTLETRPWFAGPALFQHISAANPPSTPHLLALETLGISHVYTKHFALLASKNNLRCMILGALLCTVPIALNIAGLRGASLHRG
jgi:hypothetical protein